MRSGKLTRFKIHLRYQDGLPVQFSELNLWTLRESLEPLSKREGLLFVYFYFLNHLFWYAREVNIGGGLPASQIDKRPACKPSSLSTLKSLLSPHKTILVLERVSRSTVFLH